MAAQFPVLFNATIEGITVRRAAHLCFGHGDPWDEGPRAAVERARELGPS